MPFITEEIWQAIYEGNPPKKSIALARLSSVRRDAINIAAEVDMAILQRPNRQCAQPAGELKSRAQDQSADRGVCA